MQIDKMTEQEQRRAEICMKHCPHEDEPCQGETCEEFQKEFGLGKFSKRKKRKKKQ